MIERLTAEQREGWREPLAQGVAALGLNQTVVLSDFDYTLCDQYVFDPSTNNHRPVIRDELVAAAQDQHLVIATARRASNPAIPHMWESGLVDHEQPVIAENGGTILFREGDGQIACMDLVEPEEVQLLKKKAMLALEGVADDPRGRNLVVKEGRTMVLARLQDAQGGTSVADQQWLTGYLRRSLDDGSIKVVDTKTSVTIQSADVSKATGFDTYLDLYGITREEVQVIGMGDGDNDHEIFDVADVSIGFSDAVRDLVDVHVAEGAQAATHVLRTIKEM